MGQDYTGFRLMQVLSWKLQAYFLNVITISRPSSTIGVLCSGLRKYQNAIGFTQDRKVEDCAKSHYCVVGSKRLDNPVVQRFSGVLSRAIPGGFDAI
jgi:hypothetical protein